MKIKPFYTLVTTAMLATSLVSVSWAEAPDVKMITQKPAMKMTTPPFQQNITTPAKVETPIGTLKYFDGVPIGGTKDALYDYMDRARAAQVFVDMMPAVSTYTLLQGSKDVGMGERATRSSSGSRWAIPSRWC